MKWFSHAAKRGNADALYYMANMYQHGHGVMRDVKMAEGFYVQAIENGDNYMIKKVVRACLNKHGALIK
jgi:TPR repeat protein